MQARLLSRENAFSVNDQGKTRLDDRGYRGSEMRQNTWKLWRRATQAIALTAIEFPPFCEIASTE
jgi:hypothetical protein